MLAKNYNKRQKQITGKITNKICKVIFLVDTECGEIKRHVVQSLQHKLKQKDVSEEKVEKKKIKEVKRSERHKKFFLIINDIFAKFCSY